MCLTILAYAKNPPSFRIETTFFLAFPSAWISSLSSIDSIVSQSDANGTCNLRDLSRAEEEYYFIIM